MSEYSHIIYNGKPLCEFLPFGLGKHLHNQFKKKFGGIALVCNGPTYVVKATAELLMQIRAPYKVEVVAGLCPTEYPTFESKECKHTLDTLVIPNVDFELLEEQRVILNEVIDMVTIEDIFSKREHDALIGIGMLLDSWSDDRYHGGK